MLVVAKVFKAQNLTLSYNSIGLSDRIQLAAPLSAKVADSNGANKKLQASVNCGHQLEESRTEDNPAC